MHVSSHPLPALQSLPSSDAISYGIGLPVSSNLTAPLSAWSLPGEKISVIGQSYFFPYALNAMAVTATALGITNKHVLLGTALDQVTRSEWDGSYLAHHSQRCCFHGNPSDASI